MFYKDRIKNLAAVYPKLAAVWIRTENERLPLKRVWIDESKLLTRPEPVIAVPDGSEAVEQPEEPLALAA